MDATNQAVVPAMHWRLSMPPRTASARPAAGLSSETHTQSRAAKGLRAIWSKLLLPLLLPHDLQHVLYLDCDTMACTSLWPLWDGACSALQAVRVLSAD